MRRNLQEFIEDVTRPFYPKRKYLFIFHYFQDLTVMSRTNICKIAKDVCHISRIQPRPSLFEAIAACQNRIGCGEAIESEFLDMRDSEHGLTVAVRRELDEMEAKRLNGHTPRTISKQACMYYIIVKIY
jgi:hypothetical protein